MEVTVPRVNDKRTDPGHRGAQAISPLRSCRRGCRKTAQDHRGASAAVPARTVERGTSCPPLASSWGRRRGLSAAVITRLTETWKAEQRAFAERDLSGVDYVYLWADGIHVSIRLEEHKLCLLVMIGCGALTGARS